MTITAFFVGLFTLAFVLFSAVGLAVALLIVTEEVHARFAQRIAVVFRRLHRTPAVVAFVVGGVLLIALPAFADAGGAPAGGGFDMHAILVVALTGLIMLDKIAHTFGVVRPLTQSLRAVGDGLTKNAAATPGKFDDALAAGASAAMHQAADFVDAGKDVDALAAVKAFAGARVGK